ncbi:MAG: hypothetical protein GTO41_12780, partial [Burkholderiales bacterium]|nr:hypothetical protein [Burkholderiales bacterium]
MKLSRGALFGYSLLALPLAMAALPIYVHVPKYYATTLGAPLAWIGIILFAARLLDAVQDPLLGYLSDRAAAGRLGRFVFILIGAPLLAAGFVALFQPPVSGSTALCWWLAGSLLIVYLGFSAASISYLAIGAELSSEYHERTRVTAARAALGILGVLLAATLPEFLSHSSGQSPGLVRFSIIFVLVLLVCTLLTWRLSPPRPPAVSYQRRLWAEMFAPLRQVEFRWLIAVIIPSGVASAIPATLIL